MPSAEQLEDIEFDAPEESELGHLLKTVNPAAAAAIDNPLAPPDVATWVVFKPRAGVSRMHRTEFPALVLGHHSEDGTLTLMVVMEPEDMMMETRVPFQSHNQESFCWRYRRPAAGEIEVGPEGIETKGLADRITEIEELLRGENKLGESVEVIGKRVETIESVLASDEMEALEKRIAALEAKAKKGR